VTGASGYIGSKLVEKLLYYDHSVFLLLRSTAKIKVEHKNIEAIIIPAKPDDLINAIPKYIDAVFHLASAMNTGPNGEDLDETISTNIRLPVLLLQAMRKQGIKQLINIGSYWQATSHDKQVANTIYAASKTALEAFVDYYAQYHNISAISLRLPDVYGEDDIRPKLLPSLLSTQTGGVFNLTEGEQSIYPLHVDDVVAGIRQAQQYIATRKHKSEHFRYSIFGEKTTLREWVELFCQINKLNLELIWGGKAYPPNQIFAPFHGETLPNWEQRISPEEGFSRFKL